MKIAIVGSNGFIGSLLMKHYSSEHEVVGITRDTIDLHNYKAVHDYLGVQRFDRVILCAMSYTEQDKLYDTRNLLGLFMNFYHNHKKFDRLINLGSGAEFDRDTDINNVREGKVFKYMPKDSYGFGLNMKTRLCEERDNFFTLRIFGCFGPTEASTRLLKRFDASENFELSGDRYFDYISVDDLIKVIDYYMTAIAPPKEINCVYKDKMLLSEFISLYCETNEISKEWKVTSVSDKNYTGDGSLLAKLPIKLNGIESGLKSYHKT